MQGEAEPEAGVNGQHLVGPGHLSAGGLVQRRRRQDPVEGQLDVESFNAPELHQAEWPAANGIATARALATLYGELAVDRVLSAATLDEAAAVQVSGPDKVLAIDTSFGLGFSLHSAMTAGAGFGHEGAGGSVAFADRSKGLGFAYVMNQLTASLGADRRARRLVEAVYSCL